ncbi:MAG: IS630 family transposase [Myxococcales bacterium]|nr:IS630 family transposase [Myxococcales bacterium]
MSRQVARSLLRWGKKGKDPDLLLRVQIVACAGRGESAIAITELVGCVRSSVYRTVARYVDGGREGLLDERVNNGRRLADAEFCAAVGQLLTGHPGDHGFTRPTWTRELMIKVAEAETGVRVSLAVMGRVLRRLGARRGRPKPVVACPLSDRQRRRRLAKIRILLETLPSDEVAVYEDEADIHLNPKIGIDWMPRGVQRKVMTPGKNAKPYIAGALDARDGTVLWVGATAKTSALFVAILNKLAEHYVEARRIHVVLDNYGIHYSHETRRALAQLPQIVLHFLPPYCPDHNRIERLWQDLHANVTRNHRHATLFALCDAVARYLGEVSPWPRSHVRRGAGANPTAVADSAENRAAA